MSIRDYIWNYPVYFKKAISIMAPISYVVIFTLLFVSLVFVTYSSLERSLNPNKGKVYTEATVGYVTNLNPLFLPLTQPDRDLRALVFMKLIEIDNKGVPHQAIAKSWDISSDYKTYRFKLRDDIFWSDGVKLTADDVVYTVNTGIELQKNQFTDSIGQLFSGVSVEKISDYEVEFKLERKNVSFLEILSMYIAPKHDLENIPVRNLYSSDFSKTPVGCGSYKLNTYGTSEITLNANELYIYGKPKIDSISYQMFANPKDLEVAFRNFGIDTISNVSMKDLSYISEYKGLNNVSFNIPTRRKIIFFNTRVDKLGNSDFRQAIAKLVDKKKLISQANIDGQEISGVFGTSNWAYDKSIDWPKYDPSDSKSILQSLGYQKNNQYYETKDSKILTLRLTYLTNEVNTRLAETLKNILNEEGIILELEPINFEQMTKEVLATRDYDLLLYEIETTIDPDQFDLWHSSRVEYPNLNLSGFKSDRADLYLERGRNYDSREDRLEAYSFFQRIINLETPAIFLYEPKFTFVVSDRVKNVQIDQVNFPEERYKMVYNWELK